MDADPPPPEEGPLVDPGPGDLQPGPDGVAADPRLIRDPPPQPLFSLRRLVIVLALAVAAGCIVVAAQSGGGSEGEGADAAIVAYDPSPGGQVARQAPVGVELEQGYDGRLTINGVAIPEDQMVGAISAEDYADLPAEQQDLGPRPNNKNVVKYQPGPGQAVTEYDTGTVEISVRFWKVAEGPDDSRTVTYPIRVF